MSSYTIYIDQSATGLENGTSWADAFTSITQALLTLPGIVLDMYTFIVRRGSIPYREQVVISNLIAGGSITIVAEHSWNSQAGSNAVSSRLVKNASDDFSSVEVGDKVFLQHYSAAYQGSTPSESYLATVVDASNRASGYIVIDIPVTPTTGWQYVIVGTEISASNDGITPLRTMCLSDQAGIILRGFLLSLPTEDCVRSTGGRGVTLEGVIMLPGARYGFVLANGAVNNNISDSAVYSPVTRIPTANCLSYSSRLCIVNLWRCGLFGNLGSYNGLLADNASQLAVWFSSFSFGAGSIGAGIIYDNGSRGPFGYNLVRGFSATDKLGTGLLASHGGSITQTGTVFNNVAIPKNPLNAPDPSYIS